MKSVQNIIEQRTSPYRLSSIGSKEKKPIGYSSIVDSALEKTADLIDDQKYKKWFAKQVYRLGEGRYLGLAADAREGSRTSGTPGKLFVHLLRKA